MKLPDAAWTELLSAVARRAVTAAGSTVVATLAV